VLVEPFDERIRLYGMQGVDDALALDLRWIARIGEGGDERPFGQEGPLWHEGERLAVGQDDVALPPGPHAGDGLEKGDACVRVSYELYGLAAREGERELLQHGVAVGQRQGEPLVASCPRADAAADLPRQA